MNPIKRILLSILGEGHYLSLLAGSFQLIWKAGLAGEDYQDVYFLKYFIEEGCYCLDIGAHLGYYTCELSRLSGKSGKVIAIEPMSKFNRVLGNLLKKKGAQNVELLQLALGGEGEFVEMGIPLVNKAKKFAYARVMKSSTHLDYVESEKIRNAYGDQLLAGLPRLDFIKCDVEGLEVQVFSSMLHVLEKHYPILLCELADQQERVHFLDMIAPMGYKAFILREKKLHPIDVYSAEKAISHNHYFIPSSRMQGMSSLISAK